MCRVIGLRVGDLLETSSAHGLPRRRGLACRDFCDRATTTRPRTGSSANSCPPWPSSRRPGRPSFMMRRLRSVPADLTRRGREVLRPLASGATNRVIAQMLGMGIRPATAGNHVHGVLAKLRVQSRTEAVSLALRNGLT